MNGNVSGEVLTGTINGTVKISGSLVASGIDGVSPTIDVEPIDGGTKLIITDINGTKTATINDGAAGKTAYQYAVEGGYTGTEAEFADRLANGGSGGSGVSSWNDLRDKPEGVGYSKNTVLLPETTLALEDNYCALDPSIQFVAGETYEVTWNGAIYTCKAFPDGQGYVDIGNCGVVGELPDTGEPFFAFSADGDAGIIALNGGTPVVKIVHTDVQQIDAKYLGICQKGNAAAIPETTVEVPLDAPPSTYLGVYDIEANFEIEEGRTYTVTYNGTSYSCVAKPSFNWIGNCLALKNDDITDFQLYVNAGKVLINTNGIATVTFKVETYQAYKIDPKYLPDAINQDGGESVLSIFLSGDIDNLTVDKTNAEIYEAFLAGITPVVVYYDGGTNNIMLPVSIDRDVAIFSAEINGIIATLKIQNDTVTFDIKGLVLSVNGKTPDDNGNVSVDIPKKVSELTNDSGYITGYTETDPTVPAWAKASTKPSYTKSEVGLGNVDNVKQYSASNPPPYPVNSVNGKSGAVTLDADAVGARPNTWMPTYSDVGARPATWTPTYTDVGADKSGTASSAVSTHNTKTDAHNDIRLLITALTNRMDALANSDDDTLDQMAEVVAYIKANRDLIDQITTGKVSVADIVNNLTTNVSNKPLSAAQGVALKALIDAITVPTKLSQLTNDSGYITGYTETDPTVPSWAKAASKPSYSKSEVGLGNVDNVKQYSASNPPPYPVTSVNGKTGEVEFSATDLKAVRYDEPFVLSTEEMETACSNIGAVPTTRTVNGKPLNKDITISASDVGAREDTWMPTASQVGARPSTWTPSASDVGAVPTTRKVNGKALSNDITLSASDVGALASASYTTKALKVTYDDGTSETVTLVVAK